MSATIILPAHLAATPNSASARLRVLASSTSPWPMLEYAPAAQQDAFFYFPALGWTSGDWTLDFDWSTGAASGNVVWQADVAYVEPNVLTTQLDALTLTKVAHIQDGVLGTNRGHRCTTSFTPSGLNEDDWVILRISRDGDDTYATDDCASPAWLHRVIVSW